MGLRVVEVEAHGRHRGSGFLLAPRLVLTAGHVAAAPQCRVRAAGDDRIRLAHRRGPAPVPVLMWP